MVVILLLILIVGLAFGWGVVGWGLGGLVVLGVIAFILFLIWAAVSDFSSGVGGVSGRDMTEKERRRDLEWADKISRGIGILAAISIVLLLAYWLIIKFFSQYFPRT